VLLFADGDLGEGGVADLEAHPTRSTQRVF
jgi:hypothetical protein